MGKNVFLILLFLLVIGDLNAQECGTNITSAEVEQLERMLQKNATLAKGNGSNKSTVMVNIPLKFHVFRRSDGSGGLTQNQVNNLIEQVNGFYIQSNMRFFQLEDINYVDNDDVYDFNADNEGSATVGNTIGNVINIYLFNSIISGGRALCGYTRFPPSADRVFAAFSCVTGGNTTLEHELGHYFTLYHTHGTTNVGTTDELVNQSNCRSAGDRLCDTPADPNLSGLVNNDCVYIGNLVDANGESYTPDPSNIMSYAPDRCAERFSNEQYDRIRNGFENGRANLAYTAEGFIATFESNKREVCVGESASFIANAFGATSFNWEFEGGTPTTSTSERPNVTYNSSGLYKVTLTASNNAGQSFVAEKTRYIKVIDPSEGSISESFVDDFKSNEALSSQFQVSNADNSLTFEKIMLDLEGEVTGSVFINNYDYVSDALPQVDELSTFSFDNSGVRSYNIKVEYAYNYRSIGQGFNAQVIADTFRIEAGNQCNKLFATIYNSGGANLATVSDDPEIRFIPNSFEDFKSLNFTFTPEDNSDYLLFKFRNYSYNGNNLYINSIQIEPDFSLIQPSNFRFVEVENDSLVFRWLDNSNNELGFLLEESKDGLTFDKVYQVDMGQQFYKIAKAQISGNFFRLRAYGREGFYSSYTKIEEINQSVLSSNRKIEQIYSIHPNPTHNKIIISKSDLIDKLVYHIYDSKGNVLAEDNLPANNEIDLSNYSDGIYFISFTRYKDANKQIFKIVKK